MPAAELAHGGRPGPPPPAARGEGVADANPGKPSLLQARGLGKQFPGVRALDDVDFDVAAGQVHALLGANGAGKSTLIKIFSGLYQPDAGVLRVDGETVRIIDTRHARELGISVIYQEPALVPQMTVAENIFLGQELVGRARLIDWRRTRAEAERLLEMVGANFPADTSTRDLGAGQRQLVEIAKALSTKARVLILDEPTAALSQAEAERLFRLVRELAARGVGVVYVSHRLEEIAGMVDRVTVLRDGRSVGTFATADLDRKRLVALITGEEHEPAGSRSHRLATASDRGLEVSDLSRTGEFSGVSLSVPAGELVVVTGLLGSGRTELLETLFGARVPEHGELRLHGRALRLRGPADAIAAGMALIPEDRRGQGLCIDMSVFMNVTLAALGRFTGLFGLRVEREVTHAAQLARALNIRSPSMRTLARYLSGGNQQKVVVAKWLSTDAEVLMFDEPTQGLDVAAKDEIYRLLRQFCAEGRIVLVVSSDMEEVLAIADRVVVMRGGRVVREFAGAAITAPAVVEAITHGEVA